MLKIIVFACVLASVSCRPKESTHDLLSRLGFDPIQKAGVNYHKKRVAEESDKARYSPAAYNSDTDSHMFLVRLPPHHSYYSNVNPEKLENEVVAKRPMNFPSNGKPAQVYHWNMPLIKKLAKRKKNHHDSKIVHLKIHPSQNEEMNKYHQKLRKDGKPSVYKIKSKEHIMSIKELAEHQNDRPMPIPKVKKVGHESKFAHVSKSKKEHDSKLTHVVPHYKSSNSRSKFEKGNSKTTVVKQSYNDVLKNHEKNNSTLDSNLKSPHVYSPAIPKHNSFFKYFPGNGKPKSFYVINNKEDKPSRYHRLI